MWDVLLADVNPAERLTSLVSAIAASGAGLFGGTVDNFLAASIAATIAITPYDSGPLGNNITFALCVRTTNKTPSLDASRLVFLRRENLRHI
jgi:hypothetical protein